MFENMNYGFFSGLHFPILLRRIYRPLLAFFMFLGLVFGFLCSADSTVFLHSLMRPVVCYRVSIVGFICLLLVPFLLSAYAVFLSSPLLFPLCFAKFFSFAYSAKMLMLAYGDAGWLARWLLLFSSVLSLPVLIWFCMRHVDGRSRENFWRDLGLCTVLLIGIGSFDYRVISPFLVRLID